MREWRSLFQGLQSRRTLKIYVYVFLPAIVSVTWKELSSPKTVYFYLFNTHVSLISTTLYKLIVTQKDQTSQQAHQNNSSHTWLHISIVWGDLKNLNVQLIPQTNYIRICASGTQALVFCKASQVAPICSQNREAQAQGNLCFCKNSISHGILTRLKISRVMFSFFKISVAALLDARLLHVFLRLIYIWS